MKRHITSPYALDEYFASGYEETENPFITEKSRKWGKHVSLVGALSAAVLLLVAYITHYFSPPLSALFLVMVYFLAGTPALILSLKNLIGLNVNIQVLMTVAALLSVLIGQQLEGGLLLVLFALSEALEDSVTKKTKGSLHALNKLSPTMAHVVETDRSIFPKSVKEVTLDTKILVKAGEIIPLDGIVVEGSSYVNLAHLTGESVPQSKQPGDEVQAGALNTDGTLTISVTKTSSESTLAKIIQLITEAHDAKPKLQRFLDRFSRTYATTVILLSIFFGVFIPVVFKIPYLGTEGSVYRALAFLIAASPCALIIATPTAYLSAISACARRGIILKGGVMLDAIAKCKMLAFDKTGTLTTGQLRCETIEQDGTCLEEADCLAIATGLERAVVHPIAEAILSYTFEKEISPMAVDEMKVLPGFGVEGYFDLHGTREKAVIGNVDYILEILNDKEREKSLRDKLSHEGKVTTLLLVKKTIVIFHFLDEVRPEIGKTIERLSREMKVVMLTGDHEDNANFVAKELNIDKVYSALKPEDKLRIVSELATKDPLIMVGDGINDAPALTRSQVGIAMGGIGSATAIEAADVVLLRDDLAQIGWLYERSRKTVSIVRQNLTLALIEVDPKSIWMKLSCKLNPMRLWAIVITWARSNSSKN